MAKTFAKITKTFVGLSAMIITTRRRFVLILHLEAKYAKMDYKNEIYTKLDNRVQRKLDDADWVLTGKMDCKNDADWVLTG